MRRHNDPNALDARLPRLRGRVTLAIIAATLSMAPLLVAGRETGRGASVAASPDVIQAASPSGEAGGREAFLAAYTVFMHPRCMNCHPVGDAPLQGDASRPHSQRVTRGPDGRGLSAAKCANCHQSENLPGEAMPPGNPIWHMPPPEMPMVFEGMTPAALARHLMDPNQNGSKSPEQILRHVAEDSLVLWGWDPGEGRTKPPLSHEEFVAKMREWIAAGAPIPE